MKPLTNCRKVTIGFIASALALAAGLFIVLESRSVSNSTKSDQQLVQITPKAITDLFSTRLPDTNGKQRLLADWRGKILVVNFWATWCQPCREEMPAFSRLSEKYTANNVQFVGIALDNAANVAEFSKKIPVSYPLLIAETEGGELIRQLGNPQLGLPYTLIIGGTGDVSLTRLGKLSETQLDAFLQTNIAHK